MREQHPDRQTDRQTEIHTDRQTELKYYIDREMKFRYFAKNTLNMIYPNFDGNPMIRNQIITIIDLGTFFFHHLIYTFLF